MSDGICGDIHMALGGVTPYPLRVSQAEEIVRGENLNVKNIPQAAEASVKGARALSMNGYNVDLTKALVRCALMSVWQKSKKG